MEISENAKHTSRRRRLVAVALVFSGGAIGTALRLALMLFLPPVQQFPIAIFSANIVGAFLLGLLFTLFSDPKRSSEAQRKIRLLFGTGVLGGFTTYSALATDSALLLGGGSAGMFADASHVAGATYTAAATGALYAGGTVILGGFATWLGIAAGTHSLERKCGRRFQ